MKQFEIVIYPMGLPDRVKERYMLNFKSLLAARIVAKKLVSEDESLAFLIKECK